MTSQINVAYKSTDLLLQRMKVLKDIILQFYVIFISLFVFTQAFGYRGLDLNIVYYPMSYLWRFVFGWVFHVLPFWNFMSSMLETRVSRSKIISLVPLICK